LDYRGIVRLHGGVSNFLRWKLQSVWSYTNANVNPHENTHTDANPDRDPNANADIHGYADPDGNRHSIPSDNRNTNRDPNTYADSDTNSYSFRDDPPLHSNLRANGSSHPNSGDVLSEGSSLD
jgi:hypothetical protein